MKHFRSFTPGVARLALLILPAVFSLHGAPPAVGQKAQDFSLPSLQGETIKLSEQLAKGPVVLIVLRGYPGYQCPFCNRQAQDFIANAKPFADMGAKVIMIYPGPEQDLSARAEEFMKGKTLPPHFLLALDPGYAFTNLYGLRWDAPKETAYPSTFLIEPNGTIFYALVSTSHSGRAKASDVADQLKAKISGK